MGDVVVSGLKRKALACSETTPRKPAGALVLGGGYNGLSIARSLGRRHVKVWVLAASGDVLAAASRYKKRILHWPAAAPSEEVDFLVDLAQRNGLCGWALIPTGDESSAVISRNAARLRRSYCLATPDWNVMRWTHDKRLTYALGNRARVDLPRTWYPANANELTRLPLSFPVILKPAVQDFDNAFTRNKAWRANNRAVLLARYREASRLVPASEIMVQELIPGDGETQFSYAAICCDGTPLASLTVRRTRQFPREFGRSSTFVESVLRPDVERAGKRVLAALHHNGLAEVEFKFDRRDGKYKLLDINTRVWNWHPLGAAAGVDFAYLLWLWLKRDKVPWTRGRIGVRWVRMSTDIISALGEMFKGHLTVAKYLRTFNRPVQFALFIADDMRPALFHLPASVYVRLAQRSTRIIRRTAIFIRRAFRALGKKRH
jgi:D-aspartate ligase